MLDHPLRLAVGSHKAGSGKGCALNIISWENGDTVITDLPDCADRMLARIVQQVNDMICTHRDRDLLCPECSQQVLALAHRLVGTGGALDLDRRRIWVRIAADQARQVLHLIRDRAVAERAIVAAEAWADDPSEGNRTAAADAADAASAAASAAYADAAYAANAANAANAADADAASAAASAANADAADAAYAAASGTAAAAGYGWGSPAASASVAADAAASAASAGGERGERLRLAHRAIDLFYELTGLTEHAPDPARTQAAYAAMVSQEPR